MLFVHTFKISESLSASSKTLFASFITCSRSHVRRIRPERRVWSVASSHLSPETFSQVMFTMCVVPFRVRLVRQVWEVRRVFVTSPLQRDDVTLGVIQWARQQHTEQWICTTVHDAYDERPWFLCFTARCCDFQFAASVIRLPPHLRVHLSTHFHLTWEAVTTCLISQEDVFDHNVSTEWGDFNEKSSCRVNRSHRRQIRSHSLVFGRVTPPRSPDAKH